MRRLAQRLAVTKTGQGGVGWRLLLESVYTVPMVGYAEDSIRVFQRHRDTGRQCHHSGDRDGVLFLSPYGT